MNGADWDMNWIEVYHGYGLLNGGDKYVVEVEIDTTNLEEGGSGSIYLTSNGGDAEVCVEVRIEGSTPIYHLPIYPPIASFTYVPQSPITIMFDASCSYDSDGTIVEYNWDFGDGVMGSGITYNHTYIVNGTYTVKLTVIDNDHSTDTITYNVTITNVTSYDICDFINDLGLENITFAHFIALVKLFRHGSLDSIPPEHRPNGVIKNLTEDDINAVVAYFHGDVVLGNNYAKKSCGRECIAVSEKTVHNLNTGENFSTIQAAIDDNDTKDGHTIRVYSGVYYENVVVNKPVTLIGNGQPVVDASGRGSAITLTADGITLIGFTATNSGREIDAGITVTSSNNISTGNNASSNDVGIRFWYSSNNIITGNNISNSYNGICLEYSNNNTITGNTFFSNDVGIYLSYSSNNNTIAGNNVSNNRDGIALRNSRNNKIYLSNLINNTDNVYSHNSTNIWNSTEKITYTYNGSAYTNYLGNYWGDYEEKYPAAEAIDTTGIWDTAYNIGEDKDIYPLLERFENYSIIGSSIVHPPAAEPIKASGNNFTEFYILGPNGTASGYPTNLTVGEDGKEIIGIVNHEYTNVTYQLEVWLSGELIGRNTIELKHNET